MSPGNNQTDFSEEHLPGKSLLMKSFNEKNLKDLFAFQRFAQNAALQSLIRETEDRYASAELSDDDLTCVSAAGEPDKKKTGEEGDIHGKA